MLAFEEHGISIVPATVRRSFFVSVWILILGYDQGRIEEVFNSGFSSYLISCAKRYEKNMRKQYEKIFDQTRQIRSHKQETRAFSDHKIIQRTYNIDSFGFVHSGSCLVRGKTRPLLLRLWPWS